MPTAIEIGTRAMRRAGILGVGETPTADETRDMLACMNEILEGWSLDSLMIYRQVEIAHTLTGAASYTIGPGADIGTARPLSIVGAFLRRDTLDTGIDVVSDAMYDTIGLKNMPGRTCCLRYAADFPTGRIDLWPAPESGYELHMRAGMQFSPAEHSADELILPPGYERALRLELAVDLCGEFERPVPVDLAQLAIDARAAIKRVNMQPTEAQFDAALVGDCGPRRGFDFRTG